MLVWLYMSVMTRLYIHMWLDGENPPSPLLVALECLHGHLHETILGLAIWEATDGGYRALCIVLGQCSCLFDSIGSQYKIARLKKLACTLKCSLRGSSRVTYQLDITWLLELAPHQRAQLRVRLPREEKRRRC